MERRLAAILAADVVGYSRLMEADEEATVRTLSTYREIIVGLVASHHGRVFGSAGDSVIAEFASPVEAVRCAADIQRELEAHNVDLPEDRRMRLRIGVNLGDVIVEGDNLLGDGVNIAARLETLAEPGGISLARSVFDQVKKQLDLGYEYLGEHEVKNIAEPVPVYRVLTEPEAAGKVIGEKKRATQAWKRVALAATVVVLIGMAGAVTWLRPWEPTIEPASVERMALPLPDRPSIAVLPFTNMSGDPEQEYFADGLTDDLITDLSKVSGLFVIARNSVFVYKDKPVKIRQVAEELGVRYVLEGSVRRAGDDVRINAQLIDATTGGHIWAERYDGSLDNIFAVQDKFVRRIVKALALNLSPEEQEEIGRGQTSNIEAREAFQRGWAHYLRATPENYVTAVSFLEEAVRLDPDYGRAYAALASIYGNVREKGWQTRLGLTPDDTLEKALAYLEKTREYPTPLGHQAASGFHSFAGRHEEAIAEAENAIALNANNPAGYFARAKALTYAGRPDEAIEMIRKAMRLDPLYPPDYAFHLGMSRFAMGRFDQAAAPLEEARKRVPDHRGTLTFLVATYGFLGRPDDAASALGQLKRLAVNAFVNWRLSTTVLEANIWPFKDPADLKRLREGLRLGGMPEFQDEWGLRREDRLAGDEIRRLAFDHTHQGRHPVSGLEFTITRTSDGRFTAQGLWSDTGVSRIVGDRLCNEWTKYRPSCAVIYRNPGGTPGERNEYLLVQRSGAFPFSVTE